MALKKYLAIGDLLINPDLLAYATFEDDDAGSPRLRLGFASAGAPARAEVRLTGEEATIAIRWLRQNATPLTSEGAFGPNGRTTGASPSGRPTPARSLDRESRFVAR